MSLLWKALTDKSCANCVYMPGGYFCKELKKRFDPHKIDTGLVPCEGEHFKHYASEKPIPLYLVNREGEITAKKEYEGE